MGDVLKLPPLAREIPAEQIVVRAEEGVTRISFPASSEAPVERWFGEEVLSHEPKAVRLDRAKRGAMPVLFNHNWDDPIGLVDKARIEDERLMVDVHLFDTARAKEIGQMLAGGLRNVSIGYRMHVVEEDKKTGVFTARDWEPFEVSIVSVPADPSVGIGRASGEELEVRMVRASQSADSATTRKETSTMKDEATLAAEAEAAEKQKKEQEARTAAAGYDAARAEKQRAEAIRKMANNMDLHDERAIQSWIVSGKDWNTIGDEMCKVKEERSKQAAISVASIGLTEHEAKRFSVVRAINAIINKDWTKAGFEAEVSKATAQRVGKYMNEHTFSIPAEVQNLHARVLITGTAAQGGNLVQTDLVSFIDVLRNRSVAFQAGVTVMGGLVGQVAIPKKSTAGTFAWAAETGTATAAELVLAQVTMSPKKLHGYQEYSKQLMIQSTPDVEMLVLSDLAQGLAVEVDRSILLGSGTNNPTGIRFTSGLGTANPTAGTAVVYSDMIRFQSTVAAANAMFPNFTYVTTPAVAAILMAKSRFTNSDTPIWEAGILDGRVVGMRAMATQQMTSAVMLAGDFSQAIFGQWSGMEIEVNPYANFQADIVGVKATIYADVAVRYPGAFAVGTGMTG